MAEQKATNVTWHEGSVTREERERLLGQKGVTVWMTGLSAIGKSTIAVILEQMLLHKKKHAYRLDGDNIRHGLNKNLGFSADDRAENIRRIGEVAKLFTDAGVIAITSFISPYKKDRDAVRAGMGKLSGDFDAGKEVDSQFGRFLRRFRHAADGVVIGQSPAREAGARSQLSHFGRRERAVGGCRMRM